MCAELKANVRPKPDAAVLRSPDRGRVFGRLLKTGRITLR